MLEGTAGVRSALRAIASNLAFTWTPGARALFSDLDGELWQRLEHNPTALLAEIGDDALERALTPAYVERVERVLAAYEADATRRTWWQRREGPGDFLVAYFSCEFGLDDSLPIYSGGLGVLAGDHLKSASELGVPLLGVGLFYRRGYFRQELDESGWQVERYPENHPHLQPLTLEQASPVVEMADDEGNLAQVRAQVWRAEVGRVPLYLLDTDVDGNPEWARSITDALYGGDRRHRIRQEIVLGVGGVRALRELGHTPSVFHMNEGHSAFLQLERLRELVEHDGMERDAAVQRLRASTVFTTHTPVPAGNEIFDPVLVRENLGDLVARCGFGWDEFEALGKIAGHDGGFGLTPFSLRTSAFANGVSELHGEVSREMWSPLWPGREADTVPIGSVTNGVHARSWILDALEDLLGREEDTGSPDFARAYALDDAALWSTHQGAKERLLRRVPTLDPGALTIGFARRFATYKRADLLLSNTERLVALLDDPERPVQIVFAGKSHPADEGGKRLIQRLVEFARDPRVAGRFVFMPDYEMDLARVLVQGVDVWLNNPRRPMEASGTSGMKAALNGVVNCSILDGWWCEGYAPETGFAIGGDQVAPTDEEQDSADAEALFSILEQEVVPAFYERDEHGLPQRWLRLMRGSIAQLGARFNTDRMVAEYVDALYLPAHRGTADELTRI